MHYCLYSEHLSSSVSTQDTWSRHKLSEKEGVSITVTLTLISHSVASVVMMPSKQLYLEHDMTHKYKAQLKSQKVL